jgi:hypothetical protein
MSCRVFSARYSKIAHDSKSETGVSPSTGVLSTIAGIRLFGEIRRNSGANCSPRPMLTGRRRYGVSVSSRNIVTL